MEQEIDLGRYIIKFLLGYTVGLILLSIVFYILDLDSNSGASIGVLIGAAVYTVGKFIQENKRVPNKQEKSKLVWSSIAITWGVSLFLMVAFVLFLEGTKGLADLTELVAEINSVILVGVIVFVTLLNWALLSYSYGGLAKRQFATLQKKGKI